MELKNVFIHSFLDNHLSSFQFGATMNKDAVNILYKSYLDIF